MIVEKKWIGVCCEMSKKVAQNSTKHMHMQNERYYNDRNNNNNNNEQHLIPRQIKLAIVLKHTI